MPEGQMRGFAMLMHEGCNQKRTDPLARVVPRRRREAPHPALRATFSPPSRGEGLYGR